MWLLIILGTIVVFNLTALLVKKKTSRLEMYATVVYALFFACLTDLFATYRYMAWGFFEKGIPDYANLLVVFGIYPAATVLIVNWYPFDRAWYLRFLYLLLWSVFSTGYEWLTPELGVLWHYNWNLFYSFLLYPFIYYTLIVHIRFCRRFLTSL